MSGTVGFLFGPNGHGTLWTTGGRFLRYGAGIGIGQRCIAAPRHHRREGAAVGPDTRSDRRHDPLLSPVAKSGVLVRREIGRHEDAQARHDEPTSPPLTFFPIVSGMWVPPMETALSAL
jgi:hypothetical protein